jgi:hypothetical protein
VLPLAEQALLAGQQVRAPEHERELGRLGRLDPEGPAEVEPVLVALDLDTEDRHEGRAAPAR